MIKYLKMDNNYYFSPSAINPLADKEKAECCYDFCTPWQTINSERNEQEF